MNGSFLILAYCSPRLHCFAGKKEQHCIHQNYLSDCFEKPLRFIESSKSKNNIESIKHFLSSLHKYRNRHSFFFFQYYRYQSARNPCTKSRCFTGICFPTQDAFQLVLQAFRQYANKLLVPSGTRLRYQPPITPS